MAIGVADFSYSTTHNGRYRFPPASDTRPCKRAGVDMSYQRPAPPLDRLEMNGLQSGYPSGYEMPAQPGVPPHVGDMAWSVRRSFSTSDTTPRHQNTDQAQPGAAAEKKRNKLGYHRTSIACSHCRRRKIRCIPSNSDTQGRCANCIRLKKECSFIPTEQQQSTESRCRSSAQLQTDTQAASYPSSPDIVGGSTTVKPSQQQFPPLATNVPNMPPPMSGPADGDGTLVSMRNAGQPYDVNQNVSNWMPTGIQPFPQATPPNWTNPWQGRQIETPISERNPGPPVQWAPSGSDVGSREDLAWGSIPGTARSLSYSGESIGSQHPAEYVAMSHAGPSGPTAPMSVANMGEAYQPGIESSNGPVSPVGISHQAHMQWQQHQNFQRVQGAYGNWIQGQGGDASQLPLNETGHPVPATDIPRTAMNAN